MDTFSRPANERAAEGAVAVGTGRLEQGVREPGGLSSPAARLAGARAGSAIGHVAQRDPTEGSLLSHPGNPLPCGSPGPCGGPAAPARCVPCLAPRHPRLRAQLVRGAGRPCGGVRSQTLDSGVPSRPGGVRVEEECLSRPPARKECWESQRTSPPLCRARR
ncbi:hypothetical protein GH733_017745 [Mirounga leonina]|nr:hypothetical protein GH733_017745 [Mirounga leonina]